MQTIENWKASAHSLACGQISHRHDEARRYELHEVANATPEEQDARFLPPPWEFSCKFLLLFYLFS